MKAALLILWAGALLAQTRAGIAPPREAAKAARKTTAAWNAWSKTRPEDRLLDRKPAEAMAEIDQSDRLCREYLDAKRAYYETVASAFAQEAQLLAEPALDEDHAAARRVAEERLKRIEQRASALEDQLEEMGRLPADGQSQAVRFAAEKMLTALRKLRPEAEAQARMLAAAERAGIAAEGDRKEAAAKLAAVAASLTGLAEVAAMETSDWAVYHDHLRTLVRLNSDPKAADHALGADLDALIGAGKGAKR